MAKTNPIDDIELRGIVDAEVRAAMGEIGGELSDERARAMDYYLGEPIGALAQENVERSRVVITTVRDTVEWILPQLMRIFAQSDKVVEFDAVGQEDEKAAEQETAAINHIFWRQNEGFLLLYVWMKDALLQKNGVAKFWCDESEEQSREEYDGLTDEALAKMLQDEELEAVEYEQSTANSIDGRQLHHVVFKRTIKEKRIVVEIIPPEEFLVSSDSRWLDIQAMPPRFCGHWVEKTCSELREMGFSEADIDLMKRGDDRWDELDEEWIARYNITDEQDHAFNTVSHDSLRKIRIIEGYMNLDVDGDGYNELVRIWRAGDYIDSEEVDIRPFAAMTPNIMSHKFFGLSIYDLIHDLQEISTATMRNVLDNMYQVNNVRPVVNERVDTDSLLTSRPGAPVYVDDSGPVGDAIMPFAPPAMWKDGLGLLEYMDGVRKDRTGVGDETMGLDPSTLANANTGVVLSAIEAARGKIELIARIFAETGIKWLFRGIHELARKSYDQTLRYQLNRQYVEINPQEWRRRTNLTVNVGTATGNMQQEQFALLQISQMQEKMVAGGLMGKTVLPSNIYQTGKDLANSLGQHGEKFFFNPMLLADPQVQQILQLQLPQPGPDAQTMAVQVAAQSEVAKAQAAQQKMQLEAQIKSAELELKREEMRGKVEFERMKQELMAYQSDQRVMTEREKMEAQAAAKLLEADMKAQQMGLQGHLDTQQQAIDQYRAELQSLTALQVKQMELVNKEAQLQHQEQSRVNQSQEKLLGAQSQHFNEGLGGIQESMQKLADSLSDLQTNMTKPKVIDRDKDGNPTAIGGRPIIYNDDGTIAQVG